MKSVPLKATPRDQEVRAVLGAALTSMEENFVVLVDRPVVLRVRGAGLADRREFLGALEEPCPCMVGTMSKDYSGNILLAVNLPDAITFSCLLRMVAEEGVKERRGARTYDDEDRESFAEVGNILFSAVDEVFRSKLPKGSSFRLASAVELGPEESPGELVPEGVFYLLDLALKIGDYQEGICFLAMPEPLAEAMNRGSLLSGEQARPAAAAEEEPLPTLEGTLSAYCLRDPMARLVREAAGKVGLAVDLRPPGEIPNPATLKGRFVLIEVPAEEEEKYLQWCRRLKRANPEMPLIVALAWPTRRNVLAALHAGVDQVMALPCRVHDLVRKLARVAENAPARD